MLPRSIDEADERSRLIAVQIGAKLF